MQKVQVLGKMKSETVKNSVLLFPPQIYTTICETTKHWCVFFKTLHNCTKLNIKALAIRIFH